MRVLHLAAGNLYGGVESFLVTLASHRDHCPGMEPEFGLCFEGRLSNELIATGVPVHGLGEVRFSRPWTGWQARRRLSRLLADCRFDVVVCHECWPHALFGPVVRRRGIPLAFCAHDTHQGTHWVERYARRTRPDVVVVNSRWSQSHLPNLFPGVPSAVLCYPVANKSPADREAARAAVRAEMSTPRDTVVIVQASRLERWKGQLLLLRALARLSDVPGWECWIAGGAQRPAEEVYLAELRGQADALGLGSRVRFLGQRTDVPRLLAAADIHCQPNTGPEPFGIAFIEALYAGLPLVTTAMGGALEILEGGYGVVIAPGDEVALANELARLIADPAKRARYADRGPARALELCRPADRLRDLASLLARRGVVRCRPQAPLSTAAE
jgi:glycosyltransferase involved in cell wall biosynthesis